MEWMGCKAQPTAVYRSCLVRIITQSPNGVYFPPTSGQNNNLKPLIRQLATHGPSVMSGQNYCLVYFHVYQLLNFGRRLGINNPLQTLASRLGACKSRCNLLPAFRSFGKQIFPDPTRNFTASNRPR